MARLHHKLDLACQRTLLASPYLSNMRISWDAQSLPHSTQFYILAIHFTLLFSFKNEVIFSKNDLFAFVQKISLWIKSQIISRSKIFNHHFYLPAVNVQSSFDYGVLGRLVPCIEDMGLTCWVLYGKNWSVYLLLVGKNGDEKIYFLI